jgi:hypothetical protein
MSAARIAANAVSCPVSCRGLLAQAAGIVLLCQAAGLAGCATEQGSSESAGTINNSAGVSGPLPSPPPAVAPDSAIPGVGTLIPPLTTPPVVQQNYARTIQDSNAGPAVLSLYKKAQDARAAGHPDQAEALLERAQRIDTHNPFVWQALAGVKLDLNKPDQAEQFANRSSTLARGNPYVESGNWRIIATARQARGDAGGAMQAQAQADQIARALAPE